MVTDLLGNTLLSSSSTMILRLSLGFWSSCALTYSHTPFTTCVRDISFAAVTLPVYSHAKEFLELNDGGSMMSPHGW